DRHPPGRAARRHDPAAGLGRRTGTPARRGPGPGRGRRRTRLAHAAGAGLRRPRRKPQPGAGGRRRPRPRRPAQLAAGAGRGRALPVGVAQADAGAVVPADDRLRGSRRMLIRLCLVELLKLRRSLVLLTTVACPAAVVALMFGMALRRITPDGMTAAQWSMLWGSRSEEHTSELQSRENLVCRLLL